MGKSSPSMPSAPDPEKTADSQIRLNGATLEQLAKFNRVSQSDPYGSLTWTQDPTTGQWSQTTTYSPEVQGLMNLTLLNRGLAQQAGTGALQNLLSNSTIATAIDTSQLPQLATAANLPTSPLLGAIDTRGIPGVTYGQGVRNAPVQGSINTSGLPQMQTGGNLWASPIQSTIDTRGVPAMGAATNLRNGAMQTGIDVSQLPRMVSSILGPAGLLGARQQAQDAVYRQAASRLDPQWAQAQKEQETKLADQGIIQGSEAWKSAMDDFARAKNDAYSSAQNAAVDRGLAEQQGQFGMGLSQGQFQNQAQQQGFDQLLARAGLTNQALGQQFGQDLAQQGFANSSNQQALSNLLAVAGFGNQAAAQGFNQSLAAAGLTNAAQQQGWAQLMGQAGLANQAGAQQYGQDVGLAQLFNQGQNQAYGQAANNATFGNQAAGQQFQQALAAAGLQNSSAAQALQQMLAVRAAPINEYNQVVSGASPYTPQFQAPPQIGQQIQAPNYGAYEGQNYNAQMNAYNAGQQGNNSLLGSILGLGGMALMGPLGGGLSKVIFGSSAPAVGGGYFGGIR